jgi:hypothetical protein
LIGNHEKGAKPMKISATRKGQDGRPDKSIEIEYDLPEKLSELASRYGEDIVANHARGSLIVTLQALIRNRLDKNQPTAEIQKAVNEWKPGIRVPGKSANEKVLELLGKMTPEQRAAALKQFNNGIPTTTANAPVNGPGKVSAGSAPAKPKTAGQGASA